MSGSPSGRRAVARWAWRLFRREWRQQLLVLGLVTVAVAICVGGSAFAVNSATAGRGEFGTAGALVRLDATDAVRLQTTLAAARQRFGPFEMIGHQPVAVPGVAEPLDLRSQVPHGRFGAPMLRLRSGRYPTADGEIALTKGAAALLGVHVGETVSLSRVARTVVGIVENPGDLHDDFGLLSPSAPGAAFVTLLVRSAGPPPGGRATAPPRPSATPVGFRVQGAPTDDKAVAASVLMVITVSLALVALIAAAGFVVVAQRRQRQLGLLDAIGATDRNLRLVTVANGAIVGAAAAVVGGALGVAAWLVGSTSLETAIGHRVGRFALPWTLVGTSLALAVVACTAAAWWPARMMARQPTMSALSRHPTRPAPVYRSLLAAAVLIATGSGLIVAAHPTAEHVSPGRLIAGLVAMIVGSVLVTPGAVRLFSLPARRLPFAPRLALRDLVRHQARAASALAAITLGLGISVTILVLAQANEYKPDEGNLSSHQLRVSFGAVRETSENAAEARAANDAAAEAIAKTVPGATLIALDQAWNPTTLNNPDVREPIDLVVRVNEHSFRGVGAVYVATPKVLAQLGIDQDTIRQSTDLITSLDTKHMMLLDASTRRDGEQRATSVQRVAALGKYTSGANALITPHAMAASGWVSLQASWLVQSSKAITPAQFAAARQVAANEGLTIEARSTQDDLAALRTGATIFGAVLALAIVAMTMGLLRGESRADVLTLTATGASARVRRALTASTAGALAFVGAGLSIACAYATLTAAYHAKLGTLAPIPFANLSLLLVALPLVAVAGGWLLAGREPVAFSRQLTE